MADYRKLEVWELSHSLVLAVYRTTGSFPNHERYGLTAQIRRSTVSIAANIAEGSGRGSDLDFARFAAVATASANETEYHALLAHDLGYLSPEVHREIAGLIGRIRSMLANLQKTLRDDRSNHA